MGAHLVRVEPLAQAGKYIRGSQTHRRLTSSPLLDNLRVDELPDELDAETGFSRGVRGAELELGIGEGESVGVDHDVRRADDEQFAVHHIRLNSHDVRGDHRVGEVEDDSALSRAKLDARRHLPAPFLDVFAAMLLDHEHFFGRGRDRQVGGEPGQFTERPGGKRALQPGVEFLGAESAITAGNSQRVHDAVAILVRCPQLGQIVRHGSHASKANRPHRVNHWIESSLAL